MVHVTRTTLSGTKMTTNENDNDRMSVYSRQTDEEYNLSLETWRRNNKDIMREIKKEERKIARDKYGVKTKKSFASKILDFFLWR